MVASSFVDVELIVELHVEFVGDREKIESDGSSLLVVREYVDAAIVEEEEGILRRGIGMLSACLPSFMLGDYWSCLEFRRVSRECATEF